MNKDEHRGIVEAKGILKQSGVVKAGRNFDSSNINQHSRTARLLRSLLLIAIAVCALAAEPRAQSRQQSGGADWKAVEQAMGRSGALQPGDVFKFSMPRSDLRVTVAGVAINPALALGSWAAFKKMGDHAMVMGDLVLTEDEVARVMSKLQQGGIEQTALHHHVLHESPRVLYMHIGGKGDAVKLAETVRAALALTSTPAAAPAAAPAATPTLQKLEIDTEQIEKIIGHSGKINGGVFQISVPRGHKITEDGMEIPPSMGVATAINFQPTGEGKTAITGDFVLTSGEVNAVIRALRENGIEVTALHNHMLDEQPRLFFMHFWANDDATKLARGLRAALDKTASATGQAK